MVKKRSECHCPCHTDVYGVEPIVHCVPCCEPDENLVYDPRDNTYKSSNNPALIYGEVSYEVIPKEKLDDTFWLSIANLADFYDELI